MAAAFDNGFTHFDTAPSYGFGLAEAELGRFLKTRRGSVTVTTKIGLYPPVSAQPLATAVWARKMVGKFLPSYSRLVVDWSIGALAKGFEASLRRLDADVIDILLLHEPQHGNLQSDAILTWLDDQRVRGRIRAWGLAGQSDSMRPWISGNHALASVLQVRDSIERREADLVMDHGRDLQFTFGYLSSSSRSGSQLPASEVLHLALGRNRNGSVLVSTRHLAHLGELAKVAQTENGIAR